MAVALEAWELYPTSLVKECLLGEDRESSSQHLLQDSGRLFHSGQTDIKLILFTADSKGMIYHEDY